MNPGTTTATEEDDPADPWFDGDEPAWQTDTALDEFLPIYKALGRLTDRHGAFSQEQIDRMDISVVAVLMGVDSGIGASFEAWKQEFDEWQAEQEAATALGT